MKKFFTSIFILMTFLVVAQDRSEWFEFYLPWDDSTHTITDMSGYLEAPAGKYGFLEVTPDGHFKFQNKVTNERFVGVVNVAASNFPTHEEANIIAARMAKFGINLVRIHLIDWEGTSGLFENSADNTLYLDASRLDKMDYFIKCLKEHGIYFNFCVQAGREFKVNDGIDAPIENEQGKYCTLFNQKLIDLQKDFATKTIGHVNPYTGLTYADDPVLATVEINNETTFFNGWFGWQRDYIFKETENGIGEYYSNKLDTMFNDWLAEKYGNNENLITAWEGNETMVVNELVENGSFDQDFQSWSYWVETSDAEATITIDNGSNGLDQKSAKIDVISPGTASWHVNMRTAGCHVEEEKTYKVEFYAKSDATRNILLEIYDSHTYAWVTSANIEITDSWRPYDVYMNSPFTSDNLVASFNFGTVQGTFWLDSISITETSGNVLENGESLSDRNISRSRYADIVSHTKQRIADNAEFYFDIEKEYTEEMSGFLKSDLGVQCPITFTNNYFGLSSIYSQSQADYMDFHTYWDPPRWPNGYSEIDFNLQNKSMLLNPEGSTINKMPLSKVKDKPLVLSEYNQAYPYIYQVEAPSLLYAYGSFFDLDGILWHAYYDNLTNYSQEYQDMFYDIATHPVVMTQFMLSIPYRMNSIQAAQNPLEASYKNEDIFGNTKHFKDEKVINLENTVTGTAPLKYGFQHANFNSDSSFLSADIVDPGNVVTTETGELEWDGDQGYFTVNSPYWQGATGFLAGRTIEFNNIILSDVFTTNNEDFAAIHLISLDSLPIGESKKMILLTSARLENEGLEWNETKTSLVSAGGTRALCEPVTAKIRFKGVGDSLMVCSLNPIGERADTLVTELYENDILFTTSEKTLWYEIEKEIPDNPVINGVGKKIGNRWMGDMKIFPNPAKNYTTVMCRFPEAIEEGTVNFVLYYVHGSLLFNKIVDCKKKLILQERIDTSNLDPGVYFCGFEEPDGTKHLKKLVVSK